ncbi:hypothetical protein GW17_00027739 [Ensete ventricosum]|nr:hypothetical protein GW17_00027739 [Ensete ventricosum]
MSHQGPRGISQSRIPIEETVGVVCDLFNWNFRIGRIGVDRCRFDRSRLFKGVPPYLVYQLRLPSSLLRCSRSRAGKFTVTVDYHHNGPQPSKVSASSGIGCLLCLPSDVLGYASGIVLES